MRNTIIDYFISLVKIDSESGEEKTIAQKLEQDFKELGAETRFDNANNKTGGNIGNFYAYFKGDIDKEPILFCAHMDTVTPGKNIKPEILEDRITSDGTTVLGADDKSGIAQIYCAIKELKDSNEDHAPIEVLFTISEEVGLLGAKNLDYSMIRSGKGYALDTHGIGEIVLGAPSQNSMKYIIHGKESHAGSEPEHGINAIRIASEAIAIMPMGRIDAETTCNVGIIEGGKATNIIPNMVTIRAEARSHDKEKLEKVTDQITQALTKTAEKYKLKDFQAKVDVEIKEEYSSFKLNDDDELVLLAKKASENVGLTFNASVGGGGSDANIFNRKGIKMCIAGTGMSKVHTVDEYILISDLENGAKWVKEIIREHSGN